MKVNKVHVKQCGCASHLLRDDGLVRHGYRTIAGLAKPGNGLPPRRRRGSVHRQRRPRAGPRARQPREAEAARCWALLLSAGVAVAVMAVRLGVRARHRRAAREAQRLRADRRIQAQLR